MAFVRTFGQLKPSKPLSGVAIKVTAKADANVTDIQLNPGSSLFSWYPQVGDLALKPTPAWRYINGIIQSDYDTWIMADEDQASPYLGVISPLGTQTVQWGLLHLGEISTRQEFSGYEYTLTSGAGVTPHHTARADQRLDLTTDGLMAAVVAIRGIHVAPGSNIRTDLGDVTASHSKGWAAVWAWHKTWTDVLTEHGGW